MEEFHSQLWKVEEKRGPKINFKGLFICPMINYLSNLGSVNLGLT
nr:MAG TPA: hypothetical protein [Caudoviricetes sp.]